MTRPPRSPGPARIRLASYNIRKGVGTDRVRNPLRILKVLQEVDADIIALQEADRRFGTRASVLPQVLLDHHSEYEAVPLDVQADSMGWHGNAILVRKGMQVLQHDIIHIPCLEPRGVVTATIATPAGALTVFGMHLDLSGLWRVRQARAIPFTRSSLPFPNSPRKSIKPLEIRGI
jgi:endonuclease/exonuclease/phosphatase family metal-dependent hydrolase